MHDNETNATATTLPLALLSSLGCRLASPTFRPRQVPFRRRDNDEKKKEFCHKWRTLKPVTCRLPQHMMVAACLVCWLGVPKSVDSTPVKQEPLACLLHGEATLFPAKRTSTRRPRFLRVGTSTSATFEPGRQTVEASCGSFSRAKVVNCTKTNGYDPALFNPQALLADWRQTSPRAATMRVTET